MLSRKNRFHGHSGVRRVYHQGRPTRAGLFSMHTNTNERVKNTRVAVVVSRKVNKSAVKRNRIRRRIYELTRHHLPNIKNPTEIVITVYKDDVAEIPAEKLKDAVSELFSKARI